MFPPPTPRITPTTPPISQSTIASTMNCVSMFRFFAPMARRMPISRVRSVTETSMMFMMPMPAASSAIELITAAPIRAACVIDRNWLISVSLEKSSKSSSSPGATLRIARRIPRVCSIVSSNVFSSRACTRMATLRSWP